MYQIIVEIQDNNVLINRTNTEEEVMDWAHAFDESEIAKSFKVYKEKAQGLFELIYSENKKAKRKIGFC
jgi:replicative superfamily II helicase